MEKILIHVMPHIKQEKCQEFVDKNNTKGFTFISRSQVCKGYYLMSLSDTMH